MGLSAGTRFDPDQSCHHLSGLKSAGILAARKGCGGLSPTTATTDGLRPFLYLLAEMEAAIRRGTIQWDAESAVSAQQRLDRLSAILRRIAAEVREH